MDRNILRGASPRAAAIAYNISYRCMRKLITDGVVVPHKPPHSASSIVLYSELEEAIRKMPAYRRPSIANARLAHKITDYPERRRGSPALDNGEVTHA
jgi:hypothetical protein